MLNKSNIVLRNLQNIRHVLSLILERSALYSDFDEMLKSHSGMMCLDAICMNLLTLGEMVKNLDKLTEGLFLINYPEIYWQGVMRMRDKIAHHYFEIDTEIVERTVKEDIPMMVSIVDKIIIDVSANQL